ncbi:hypothetical protein PILCRDRAFT_210075 [Piloderma croceum F 1598]|uniref:Uncharacterized protein n=1 Tax=Piloderma croceum (strain F 1598) TaxID=765440 RepID=A0A0C3GBG4_PILCF|nr:hypothetical protein PILCRDRAFT_210075 [Piloderma croceum F 1598]
MLVTRLEWDMGLSNQAIELHCMADIIGSDSVSPHFRGDNLRIGLLSKRTHDSCGQVTFT